jgi:predicted RNase H-like HicB family nuclease
MIYRSNGDYSALVPDLPGCVAVAASVMRVRKMMAKAITMHLESMRETGQKIPVPRNRLELTEDEIAEVEFCTWVEVKPSKAVAVA